MSWKFAGIAGGIVLGIEAALSPESMRRGTSPKPETEQGASQLA